MHSLTELDQEKLNLAHQCAATLIALKAYLPPDGTLLILIGKFRDDVADVMEAERDPRPKRGTERTTSDPHAAQAWEATVRTWGHACTFSHQPGDHPTEPYAARRRDGQGTIRAATPALLLDAIKDDAAARPFTATGNPA